MLLVMALLGQLLHPDSAEARFWTWFTAHDAALFAVKTAREPVCDELAAELHRVDGHLTFEFGPVRGGKREFVISADGIREAFPAVIALARAAPPMKRWTVTRFRPPSPEVTQIKVSGIDLDARAIEFLAMPGDRTDLVIAVPGFKKTPESTYESAVYLLLDGMLGEYTVEMAIGGIQIIPMTNRPQGACGGLSPSLQKLSLCGRYRSDLRGEARSGLILRIFRPP